MKHYSFKCFDENLKETTIVEFSTEKECWAGVGGPMSKFVDFLHGCGYIVGEGVFYEGSNGDLINALEPCWEDF